MGSHNGSIHTTHTPPPLSFYNTFKVKKVPKWKRINASGTDAQAKQGKNKNKGHFLILCTRVFLYVPVRYSFVNLDFLGSQMALA